LFLSGGDVGQVGVVVDNAEIARSIGRFTVKLPCDPDHVTTMVNPEHDLFIDRALMTVPQWMPPLSIEDACALHEMVLDVLRWPPQRPRRKAAAKMVKGLIARCWGDRLPVSGAEVWGIVAAHGALPELEKPLIELFEFGMELIVETQGRPPVKRRRMPPLSRGRYLTKRNRELWLRHFGHD
jgi:hypothetical protein